MNTRYALYPKILERHSIKMTEERFSDWRNTMKIIVDMKNGKMPEDAFEHRHPPYLCKEVEREESNDDS